MKIDNIIAESQHKCPHCGGPVVEYSELMEKKDACYYKVKASAKVWPSAYASGRLVQCRKKGSGNYGKKNESVAEAANAAQQAAIAIAKKKKAGVDEAAPPGAKAERMVKHIKKGYAKDGKLSDKEKSIAYATAWKAHNKGVTEGTQRVDSLVTDALKIMQGSEANDAVSALKTVLGDREYNSRRGYYNFYVRQLMDMSGQSDISPRNEGIEVAEDANPDYIWIQGDFDGDTATTGSKQGSWRDQQTTQVELTRGRMSNVRPLSGPPPEGGKTIKQAQIPLTLDAGNTKFSTTGVDLQLTVAPNGYISQGGVGRVRGTAVVKIMRPGNVAEDYNPEYDDEAGMADNNLETLSRAVDGIDDLIQSGDNLPEWCQEKIAVAKSMLVAVWDYMYSEEASDEVDPEVDEMFEAMDQLAEEMAIKNRVSKDLVWEQFEAMPDNMLYETAAWRRKEGKSKKGGLNAKGVASYRRENPGSKLQTAVTTKPSKLKPGSKAAKRRKSFCARMGGVKGPMKKPNGKPTRKALALRKWNC
jgi:hypothetical protein